MILLRCVMAPKGFWLFGDKIMCYYVIEDRSHMVGEDGYTMKVSIHDNYLVKEHGYMVEELGFMKHLFTAIYLYDTNVLEEFIMKNGIFLVFCKQMFLRCSKKASKG